MLQLVPHHGVRLPLQLLSLVEHSLLRGREQAVESPEDGHRQNDLAVFVPLVRPAEQVADAPDEVGDLAVGQRRHACDRALWRIVDPHHTRLEGVAQGFTPEALGKPHAPEPAEQCVGWTIVIEAGRLVVRRGIGSLPNAGRPTRLPAFAPRSVGRRE